MSEISKKEIKGIVNAVMKAHIGPEYDEPIGEGGCPRISWYGLRNELVKALAEAAAHARAEAVGVKDASYIEMLIDNAATASQCDFDAVTREAIRLNIIDPLLGMYGEYTPATVGTGTALARARWREETIQILAELQHGFRDSDIEAIADRIHAALNMHGGQRGE